MSEQLIEEQTPSPHPDEDAAVEDAVAGGANDETPPALTPSPSLPHSPKLDTTLTQTETITAVTADNDDGNTKTGADETPSAVPVTQEDVRQDGGPPSPPELPTSSPSPPGPTEPSLPSSSPPAAQQTQESTDTTSSPPAVSSTQNTLPSTTTDATSEVLGEDDKPTSPLADDPSTTMMIMEDENANNNKPSVANSETTTAVEDETTSPVALKDTPSVDKDATEKGSKVALLSSSASTPSKPSAAESSSHPAVPPHDLKVAAILDINSELIKYVS